MERRSFLQNMLASGLGLGLGANLIETISTDLDLTDRLLKQANTEDQFWQIIRNEYTVSPNIINLNNGGVSPQPRSVQEAHIRFYRYSNEAPSHYMWHVLDKGREPLRRNLANLAGCDAEEIAINRNSTEGLNSIIFGLDFNPGDEIVLCNYDYPNMKNAWKQRAKRDGLVLKWVDIPVPCTDKEALIRSYADAFTDRTKLVHLTHVINWSGQIIPVAEIAQLAKSRDIEVLVDGAHSFAHLDFKIEDLQCDYFATSLHKWLSAPFGSGLMYIKKDKISKVWALLSADEPDGPDIRKFESLGTRSFASEMAIGTAIDFHHMIGGERKEQRLRYLKNYWLDQVKSLEKINIYTPQHDNFSGAIAVFGIEGLKAQKITERLFNDYKIHSVAIEYEAINGVRITPNVYTSERDLDILVEAIHGIHRDS